MNPIYSIKNTVREIMKRFLRDNLNNNKNRTRDNIIHTPKGNKKK